MLIEFKVANYRSIRAEQTLSMVASNYSDELPQNLISCDHVPGLKGTKLVKAVALYGANASGKSNIVAALRFFAEFVRDSATKLQPGAPTGAQPFKLDPACLTQPSKFEITAVINGIRTLYGIEMTRERVTSEYLVAYPKGRPQVWFERDWDETKAEYKWTTSPENFPHDRALHGSTRENMGFLSTAAHFNQRGALVLWKWFASETTFLNLGETNLGFEVTLELLRSDEGRRLVVAALSAADLGVVDATMRRPLSAILRAAKTNQDAPLKRVTTFPKPKTSLQRLAETLRKVGEGNSDWEPTLYHRGAGDEKVRFNFRREESAGTRRFFNLLGYWFTLTTSDKLMSLDEIETSLHPSLANVLLQNFLSLDSEKVRSQLLFTTHNPLLLDQTLLRRDQIWFTEKDQEGATRLYPLTDFKPRKDESLVKGYLAGRYGGIPFIPEGLKF